MNLPKRKPTRLKGYDYSQDGAYFITICTNDRKCILGNIVGQEQALATISNVICSFKSLITKICNKLNNKPQKIFQTSFHDHIIRGEKDYQKIWEYIDTNVIRWEKDCFYN